jgi:hypothetical protein
MLQARLRSKLALVLQATAAGAGRKAPADLQCCSSAA